jgi:hypothetical protein
MTTLSSIGPRMVDISLAAAARADDRGVGSAPRPMPSDQELLARFQPRLRYDSQEAYFADDAAMMSINPGNRLLRERVEDQPDVVIAVAPALVLDVLDADGYHDTGSSPVLAGDRLSITGKNYRDQYSKLRTARPDLRNRLYGHVVRAADGTVWLQYWFFYFYNDYHLAFDVGLHEGDWEMIQLRLDGDTPDVAVYAQHTYAEVRPWTEVERVPGAPDTPVVYPGRGSHASYFESGAFVTEAWFDIADGGRDPKQLALTVIDDDVGWVRWPGRWGDTPVGVDKVDQPSPQGPGRHGQWHDPDSLLATARSRPSARKVQPADAPETSVERSDGKLDVVYDLRHHPHDPPVKIIVTVNSRDEHDVAPRTFTFDAGADHGTIRTGVAINPRRHYDIRVSSVDGSQNPSASRLTIFAPSMAGGLFAAFREWLARLVQKLTHRGRAQPAA